MGKKQLSMWRLSLLLLRPDTYYWTEDVCSVALTLLKKGVTITEVSVGKLIRTLQKNAATLCKSSKFAKLVIEVCKSTQDQAMVRATVQLRGETAICSGTLDNFSRKDTCIL